jgi:hypothetical protein
MAVVELVMGNSLRPSESPSEAVKRLVAERENCHQSQLGNLDDVVDIAALDQLPNPPIKFRYCGYHVVVTADETIKIES